MPAGMSPRILLCASRPEASEDIRQLLETSGHSAGWHPLNDGDPLSLKACQLVVLECSANEPEALRFCRRVRAGMADSFVPILFITENASPATRLASLEAGADICVPRPFAPGELLCHVRALLRIQEMHGRLAEKTAEVQRVNQQLKQAYQRIDQELEMARRLQMSFLPQKMPEVPRCKFAVQYRPCGRVGGDFYDVFRLDESHVGFYVADAMGHGVPASLMTIFLKRGVQTKEISGKNYRLLPPSEVLQRLNRDLVQQNLAESPFITMVYGLYDFNAGALSFSRAGHPHPVHVPAAGAPKLLQIRGSLLGVFQTEFDDCRVSLAPGDKLLVYTDGADTGHLENDPTATERVLELAAAHRHLPIAQFVERLSADLMPAAPQADDITLLGLECLGPRGEA